jgi:DnaJ-class molecular chaperone
MPDRDYYEVLGVSRSATADQIKQAYRKLAKQYHPDRNPNDKSAEGRFKEVQAAYDVLGDIEKRQAYDQFGHAGVGRAPGEAGWRAGPGGQRVYTWKSGGGPDIPIEDWEDLFSTFSGGGGASPRGGGGGAGGAGVFDQFFGRAARRREAPPQGWSEPEAGRDIEQEITLSFEQAISGTTLNITLPNAEKNKKISVKIPSGVAEGQRIRVRGKGLPSAHGGTAGDLYILCRVQPHRFFKRIDNDIYLDLPITITEATLGARIEIPTLEGRSVLTIPSGTPSGTRLRLKGKGVKSGDKPAGDQFAIIKIVPPKTISDQQRELLEKFGLAGEGSPRANLGW